MSFGKIPKAEKPRTGKEAQLRKRSDEQEENASCEKSPNPKTETMQKSPCRKI